MGYPKNPDKIIIKNTFYPSGLTEIKIWNHYQKYKNQILLQLKNRNAIFVLKIDDKFIIKRKDKAGYIRLNKSNYDELITGRLTAIYGTMNRSENFAIVDIDTSDFNLAKKATYDTYIFLTQYVSFIKDAYIRFTGKDSFHIICLLKSKMDVNVSRTLIKKLLDKSKLSEQYTINPKRSGTTPNLDLYINQTNGAYILENAISKIGLQSMRVSLKDIKNFKKNSAIIK